MAHILTITHGATTIDLAGDNVIIDYVPQPGNGETVTESAQIRLMDTSSSDLLDCIHSIETAFRMAREYQQTGTGDQVFVNFAPGSDSDAWRSEILDGKLVHNRELLGYEWANSQEDATLAWTRRDYWDGPLTALTVSNTAGSTDGWLAIYNHTDSDAGHENWVQIASTDIDGNMPGPAFISIDNTYATQKLYSAWIGQNWTSATDFEHILEGESSTAGSTNGTDSDCSGGAYSSATITANTWTDLFTWTLSDTDVLAPAKGSWFKVLAAFTGTVPVSARFRLKFSYQAATIYQTGITNLDSSRALATREIATVRIPPWLPGDSGLAAIELTLQGWAVAATQVDLDFLQLTPLDGYRFLDCVGYGADQNYCFVDDAIEKKTYLTAQASPDDTRVGLLNGYGQRIHLYPGKTNRLYFLLHSNVADTAEADRTAGVKVAYRPRRRTL